MLVAQTALSQFFEEAVAGSMQACRVDASAPATGYLVSLLQEFTRPDQAKEETLERPVSVLLDEALHNPKPAERFEKLRAIGDGVLYTAGFFGDHFERRGVDQKFVCTLGARAYGSVSGMLGSPDALDVFGELAEKFDLFVIVLSDVADQATARTTPGLVRLYERWLKTKNDRLAGMLGMNRMKGVS
jgi:hypothetical protein